MIYEVQTTGGSGATDEDVIKLYNPNSNSFAIGGWKLRKRTQSGSESSIKEFDSNALIPAAGFYIWANSKNDFASLIRANSSSTQTLADNNSAALLDVSGAVIDAVAWGSGHINPFAEGPPPYPVNPATQQVLRRILVDNVPQDTDSNQNDFEIK